jgi:hypothetical protein
MKIYYLWERRHALGGELHGFSGGQLIFALKFQHGGDHPRTPSIRRVFLKTIFPISRLEALLSQNNHNARQIYLAIFRPKTLSQNTISAEVNEILDCCRPHTLINSTSKFLCIRSDNMSFESSRLVEKGWGSRGVVILLRCHLTLNTSKDYRFARSGSLLSS